MKGLEEWLVGVGGIYIGFVIIMIIIGLTEFTRSIARRAGEIFGDELATKIERVLKRKKTQLVAFVINTPLHLAPRSEFLRKGGLSRC